MAWRLNHDAGIDFHNWYDGYHWGDAAIWKKAAVDSDVPVDDTPRVGSIAWWAKGSPGSSRGHVAWVMSVSSSSITIEEYNYLHAGRYDTRTISETDDKWPTAFIHLGDLSLDNTARPTVSGDPQVGVQLTASPGTWTPSGATYAYQWYAGGEPVDGATRRTFTPKAEQEGKRLRVEVTATSSASVSGTASSTRHGRDRAGRADGQHATDGLRHAAGRSPALGHPRRLVGACRLHLPVARLQTARSPGATALDVHPDRRPGRPVAAGDRDGHP